MKFTNPERLQMHGDIICYTTLICDFGLLCLDWRDICDGIQQCMFGYDEENCDRLEFNECEDDEYRCMNGMCIPDEYFLDGEYDCMDLTDEKQLFNDINCTFQKVNLECDDRVCLPNQWSCGDGQCIRSRFIFQELSLLEALCSSRRDQFYMCETGSINKRWTLPNGRCDGSKEYEEDNVLSSSNGEICIYYFKCQLTHGAEKNCPCRYEGSCEEDVQYWCPSFITFPKGNIITPYGRTIYRKYQNSEFVLPAAIEVNATIKCRGFQITRIAYLLFTGAIDVRDLEVQLCTEPAYTSAVANSGYDRYCHNGSLTVNNRSYHFIDVCSHSKECISAYRIKDGIRNCADELDENSTKTIVMMACSHIKRHRFRCSIDEPTCLFANILGDKHFDCKNKHDESWMNTTISLSEMNCNRKSKKDCQLIRQYIEASWITEPNVIYSQQSSTTKIPFRSFCDTFYDLGSKKDEDASICHKWWKCLDEQWQCQTGQCINVKWVLDGEWDCSDASDEESMFIYEHASLLRNLKLINMSVLMRKFKQLYNIQTFFNICNLNSEYPCFRINIPDPLNNITHNRPCINLKQLGDGHIDCIGGIDERNTIQHCTEPTTLGHDFMCLTSRTCISQVALCLHDCPHLIDNHFLCYSRRESLTCKDLKDSVCMDGTCIRDGKCNNKYDCSYGEDEYMCDRFNVVLSETVQLFYRERKRLQIKSIRHKFKLPRLPLSINHTMNINLSILSVQNTTMNIRSLIPMNSPLPYVCNRGVGVLNQRGLMVCFCPPQYYGIKCEFHNDRVTVILHLDLSQSIYAEVTDPRLILKLLILFLFENQTLSTYEFHVRPAMESVNYNKLIHHFLYSRSNISLSNKRMRYFDRSKIIKHHPYAIRIEAYELNTNETAKFIAIWHYPIHFDYLPSFRLSKVLRLMKSNDINNPCSSYPCAPSEKCYQLQNQRSTYVCLCPDNITGTNCSILDQLCINDFCSLHGLCKPAYRSLLIGNELPYCICSLNTFGSRCGLIYDSCIENRCQNNGTCLNGDKPNEFLCICNNRYYGKQCEFEKLTVELHFNGSIMHTGVVVQYFRLNFISLDLTLIHQRVFITLPNVLFTVHDDDKAPEVILIKFYTNKQIMIHLISFQIDVILINETIQLTETDRCMPVRMLWPTTESIYPTKYHSLCINDSTLICFHDEDYLCICSAEDARVECFGYNHYLEKCSHCLAGGQCLQEDHLRTHDFICLCPKCRHGSLCQFNTEIQSFSLDSLFAEISFGIALLYLTLTILIFIIGALTNCASFVTFKRSKPRKLGVGKYLLVNSVLSQGTLFLLFIKTIQNIFRSTLTTVSCKIISYMLSVFTRSSFWLISWVTLERLFIVISPLNTLFKTPRFTWTTIFITFIIVGSQHIHDLIFYIALEDTNEQMICVGNFAENWLTYNRITLIIHYILPFAIQIVSITVLIILTARSRSNATTKNNFIQLLKQQFDSQRELYVTPLIIILSGLPQALFSFIFACTELSIWQRHVLLTAYFLSYAPQWLGFVLFVLPSTTYLNEFQETQLAKRCLFKWLLPRK